MKKSLALLWTIAATVGLLVVGCNKNTNGPEDDGIAPPGVTDEQSAMKYYAINDEFVKNDEQTFADQDVQPTDYGYLSSILDPPIIPLRWGRFIDSVSYRFTLEIQTGDTIAIGRLHKNINGRLKIKGLRGTDTVLVVKPFRDISDRNIIFKRIRREPKRFWLNWLPVATSLVQGDTPANRDINITQIDLIARGRTVTITDPLNFYLRYHWLRLHNQGNDDVATFNGGDSVKVRVTLTSTSTSPDTDLVALRFGFNSLYKNRAKMNLVSQSERTKIFERTFYVHPRPGFFHAAVEAATKATLFDDDPLKYSVSWWGVPYRVF